MPDYALQLADHHITTYRNNVMLATQQTRNPLAGTVTEVAVRGKAVRVADIFGQVEANFAEERSRRNPENPVPATARWLVKPPVMDNGQYIDDEDMLQMAMDPTGNIVRAHVAAVNRKWADQLLGIQRQPDKTYAVAYGGILGKSREGAAPGAGTDLPSSQFIPHGGTGLTLEKLIEAQQALNLADFGMEDDDQLYCAITPRQVTNLLEIAAQADASLSAFTIDALKTGKPTSLMGFTWVRMNRLPTNEAGHRLCPVWSKRNIIAGVWQGIQGDAWQDTGAKKLPYVYVSACMDATRAEDKGVIVIPCVE